MTYLCHVTCVVGRKKNDNFRIIIWANQKPVFLQISVKSIPDRGIPGPYIYSGCTNTYFQSISSWQIILISSIYSIIFLNKNLQTVNQTHSQKMKFVANEKKLPSGCTTVCISKSSHINNQPLSKKYFPRYLEPDFRNKKKSCVQNFKKFWK